MNEEKAQGWYPDPATGRDRWWNGRQWTDTYKGQHA